MERKVLLNSTFSLLLVIFVVIDLTTALPRVQPRQEKNYFKLEDFFPLKQQFSQRSFDGTWISETEIWHRGNDSDYYIFDAANGQSNLFISGSDLMENVNTTNVVLSKNKEILLARSDPEQGFRHSSSARYAIYDIQSSTLVKIADHQRLPFCQLIGETDISVVFVLDNNLYVKRGLNGDEIKITTDGIPGVIYNGIADWVYEEEVLSSGSAVWFSPSFDKVAFARFDDTDVEDIAYVTYGKPGSVDDQYPVVNKIKYPKVGRTNPTVTLKVTNLQTPDLNTIVIAAPVDEVTNDHILYRVSWISETELSVLWTNRRQNKSVLIICNPITGLCDKDLIRTEPDGWVEVHTPRFSSDGGTFLDIDPVTPQGAEPQDQWYHLVRYNKGGDPAKQPSPLTFGRKTVRSIIGWNENTNKIYYIASPADLPWEQHLYVVSGNTDKCISCDVELPGGDKCTFAAAWAPKEATYYALSCETNGNPAVTEIYNSETDTKTFTWQDNENLRQLLTNYHMPRQELLLHPIPSSNATVQMFLPPQLDMNDPNTKYPMVVYLYAGPNSVLVQNKFLLRYETYMATNRGIIYCFIDGRGTGNKGKQTLFSINNALGSYEVEDIVTVTRELTEKYPWIDKDRVGIWGWSYGGYASAMAIVKDEGEVFNCSLSVAPVISWLYYDSIYTERYMGLPTPEDNLIGYESSDVSKRAKDMLHHRWMVLHGNADDNAHYQNTMAMAKALQELDIPFEMMSYPDEAHGISGVNKHVYHTIDDYWTRCFYSAPSSSSSYLLGNAPNIYLFLYFFIYLFVNIFQ